MICVSNACYIDKQKQIKNNVYFTEFTIIINMK